jgi:hypothetical protein
MILACFECVLSDKSCGQSVSRAQADVQKFAKDVIHWVSEMQSAFQSHKSGHFTRTTKCNLAKMWYA